MEKLMLASQSIIMTAVTLHRIARSLSVKQVAEIQKNNAISGLKLIGNSSFLPFSRWKKSILRAALLSRTSASHLKKVALHITCKRTIAHNGEASAPKGPNRQAYCRRRASIALPASRARAGQQRRQEHGFLQRIQCPHCAVRRRHPDPGPRHRSPGPLVPLRAAHAADGNAAPLRCWRHAVEAQDPWRGQCSWPAEQRRGREGQD